MGKFYHVTTLPTLAGDYRLRKPSLVSLIATWRTRNNNKKLPRDALRLSNVSTRKQSTSNKLQNQNRHKTQNKQKHRSGATLVPTQPKS